jgi:hypothetical protein
MWLVRLLLVVCLFLAPSLAGQSQQTTATEEAISKIIDLGLFEGHDSKVIGGIGDAAAVTVTKVLGGRSLTASQIDSVLVVLQTAFGEVKPGPEAEPRTALFVLRELGLSTSDAQLRAKIEQTRKYVQEEYSKSQKRSSQN